MFVKTHESHEERVSEWERKKTQFCKLICIRACEREKERSESGKEMMMSNVSIYNMRNDTRFSHAVISYKCALFSASLLSVWNGNFLTYHSPKKKKEEISSHIFFFASSFLNFPSSPAWVTTNSSRRNMAENWK